MYFFNFSFVIKFLQVSFPVQSFDQEERSRSLFVSVYSLSVFVCLLKKKDFFTSSYRSRSIRHPVPYGVFYFILISFSRFTVYFLPRLSYWVSNCNSMISFYVAFLCCLFYVSVFCCSSFVHNTQIYCGCLSSRIPFISTPQIFRIHCF